MKLFCTGDINIVHECQLMFINYPVNNLKSGKRTLSGNMTFML